MEELGAAESHSAGGRNGASRALPLDAVVCVGVASAVVAISVVLWALGGGRWFEQAFLNVVGWTGASLSLVGVLLAYLIFRRQSREAASAHRYQRRVLTNLQAVLVSVDEKVSDLALQRASDSVSDADAEQSSGVEDLWDGFTPQNDEGAVYLKSPSGKRRRVYLPATIPLAVLGALVRKWDEHGLSGRWPLGTLRGAFRAEGKGNHPWYLVFVPPTADSAPVIWKVTRGPGGTDHAMQVKDGKEFR